MQHALADTAQLQPGGQHTGLSDGAQHKCCAHLKPGLLLCDCFQLQRRRAAGCRPDPLCQGKAPCVVPHLRLSELTLT